jgi:hypothetical protein
VTTPPDLPAPAAPARPPRALWLLGLGLLLIARRPDAVLRPQFWAEDGMFYVDALVRGSGSLLLPYAGYLHLGPRGTALLAAGFDPLWAPGIFTAVAAAVLLGVLALVLSARMPVAGRPWFALAVVLVPDAREVFFNLTNLQWVLALGLIVLLLLPDPQTPAARAGDGLLALFGGLSGPFSLLFAPLFAVRAWRVRTPWSAMLATLLLATGAVQGWYIAHGAGATPEETGPVVLARLPAAVGLHLGVMPFAGWLPAALSTPAVLTAAGLALAAGLLALLCSRAAPAVRWTLGAAIGLLLASAFYRCRHYLPELLVRGNGERYFFLPEILAVWLLLAAAGTGKIWRIAARGLFSLFVLSNLLGLRFAPFVDYDWPRHAAELRAGRAVRFPVNPPGMTIDAPARPR